MTRVNAEAISPASQGAGVPTDSSSTSALADALTNAVPTAASDAADVATSAASDAADMAVSAASDAADMAVSAASDVSDAASQMLGDASESMNQAVDQAAGALGQAAGNVTGAVGQAAGSVTGAMDQVSDAAANSLNQVTGAASQAVSSATSAYSDLISNITGTVSGATSQLQGSLEAQRQVLNASADSLTSQLPPELQDVVREAASNSDVALALIAVLLVPSAASAVIPKVKLLMFNESIDANPEDVLETLKSKPRAFLIDTRTDAERLSAGVPDIRGNARLKVDIVEVDYLPSKTRNQVTNPNKVELTIAAIKARAMIGNASEVYVMDQNGRGVSKDLAGALRDV
eukprot:CAMPEP_0197846398 /NCGR_PEP_ID=MMETSP1438-20131217/3147_1 /TAXON_ID=1461541 /ORGANISM="Pterosperma sp., Strain CCMP1384" /LENGTH=346 /DNA_ID=CAMNT_0043458037 /DNA_START=287 /DNA_END=1324 /DNA_ORIENTATION=-